MESLKKEGIMKKKLYMGFFFFRLLIITVVVFTCFSGPYAYAVELQIIGDEKGIEVIHSDNTFFNELNLEPREFKSGKVTISNKNDAEFRVYLLVDWFEKEPALGEPDLYAQILATLTVKEKVLYSGPMIGFAGGEGISLANLLPGESQEIDILLYLPGKDTGNEFMDVTHINQGIFTAIQEVEEESPTPLPETPVETPTDILPKTGTSSNSIFILTGLLLIAFGASLGKKTKK